MKIGIFTLRSVKPLHPRVAAFLEYFDEKGWMCDIIPGSMHRIFSRVNWLSLFFYDRWSVFKNKNKTTDYDLILINDLKLLPLARHAKKNNKTVIYDTIDNNVALRGYSLLKKIPVAKFFSKRILSHYSNNEKKLASLYCDIVIVNSKALLNYFNNRAELLYYYSEFERSSVINDSRNRLAFIYLGEFSEEKGAEEILELRKKMNTELFIFGSCSSDKLRKEIQAQNISHIPRISQMELLLQIEKLMETWFLAGLSFIKPVHLSYATQEANKDIDYLALGIPIIGNHRIPTAEKIDAGCGVFIDNESGLFQLEKNENFKHSVSDNCKHYYRKNYSKDLFRIRLDGIFSRYMK